MIYDHIVKVDGEYYAAGEEVPEKEECSEISAINIPIETDTVIGQVVRRGRPKKLN